MRCPLTGFDGAPMLRLAPIVTRKSLPSAALTAIVAASVRVATAGDSAAPIVPPLAASALNPASAVACPVPPSTTGTGRVMLLPVGTNGRKPIRSPISWQVHPKDVHGQAGRGVVDR